MAVIGPTTITTAVTAATSAATPLGTGGVGGAMIQIDFVYGSGGTSGKIWVQTSFDGGTTWIDVANMTFLLASKSRTTSDANETFAGSPLSLNSGVSDRQYTLQITVPLFSGGLTQSKVRQAQSFAEFRNKEAVVFGLWEDSTA